MEEEIEEVGYLEDIEIHHDAEDVKTVRFIGSQGTADVSVTDETMKMFLEAGERVFKRIHSDMAEIEELFREYSDRDIDDEFR